MQPFVTSQRCFDQCGDHTHQKDVASAPLSLLTDVEDATKSGLFWQEAGNRGLNVPLDFRCKLQLLFKWATLPLDSARLAAMMSNPSTQVCNFHLWSHGEIYQDEDPTAAVTKKPENKKQSSSFKRSKKPEPVYLCFTLSASSTRDELRRRYGSISARRRSWREIVGGNWQQLCVTLSLCQGAFILQFHLLGISNNGGKKNYLWP